MKRTPDKPIEPTLPITPMLDMTFQLFAFFVFTYHPQALEGKIDFTLPAVGDYKAESIDKVDPNKIDTDVDLDSDMSIEIKAVTDGATAGNISQILVKTDADASGTSVELDNKLDNLKKFLIDNRKDRKQIKVGGDSLLKYAFIIQVTDICRQADFEKVGYTPPPDAVGN
jgi:biopolymer transport protein ExbD